jgi:DNA-binding SARP family transcriptional activator/tetratricopeptide (TPR) repeat protein
MLRVNLFGAPAILTGDGTLVRLRSRKQLGVLLYLALEGREQPVSRDQLMEYFWPDVPRDRAYQSLCQAVTEIRAVLGRGAVTSVGESLALAMPVVTDLDRLVDDLERLDLSAPLGGVDWWGGPALGHWLEATRARCRRMAEDQLREGIERFRRLGLTPRVHRCAAILYELDPLAEPAVLALADEALLRGDVVGAIRLLRTHLARLSEALGCRPQPNVERLLRRLEVGAHPPVELVPRRLAAQALHVRPPILVARERELATLEGEWQRVRADGGVRTLLITGPGGIGKSSLIRRFAASVAARAQSVYVVSCQEIGEGIPYAATSDLAAALLLDPTVSATDPIWLSEVSRIHPVLRSRYPGVPAPMETPADTVRLRIADGLTHMLEAVAEGTPVAVLFDDMHYMDPATRGVLYLLLRRAGQLPLLLVGSARARGLEQGLTSGPLEGESVAWSATVRLGPLDREGTRTLISALAPSLQLDAPRVADRIVELSEGNPHFVEMLLSDWERHAAASLAAGLAAGQFPRDWQPPDSLRQAFQRLYDGLATAAQRILHVLAVAQRALTAEEVAEALGQLPARLDAEALELLSRGILRLDSGALCFKNELHRAYVYFAMAADTRKYFHALLGRAMQRLAGESGFRRALEAGHHLLRSGDTARAPDLIRSAARRAMKAGASAEAEEVLLELAASEEPTGTPDTLLALACAQLHRNRPREAVSTLSRIGLECCSERAAIEKILLELKTAVTLRTSSTRSLSTKAEAALHEALESGHPDLALEALQLGAEFAAEEGDLDRLEGLRGICQQLAAPGIDTERAAQIATSLGFIHLARGEHNHAAEAFRSGIARLKEGSLAGPALWRLQNGLGMALTGAGQYDAALSIFTRIHRAAQGTSTTPSPLLWSNMAVCCQERGLMQSAAEHFGRAIRALRDHPDPRARATVFAASGSLATDLGEMDLADRCIRLAEDSARASEMLMEALDTSLVRADFWLAAQEDEFAWKSVRDRVLPLGDRRYAVGEAPRHERLIRHYKLVVAGLEGYQDFCLNRDGAVLRLTTHGRAELACFHDWVVTTRLSENGTGALGGAIQEGLGGTILHLCAVGTLPPIPQSEGRRISGLRLVYLLPELFRESPPTTLDWCLPDS